jgi:hypothetical protein
MIFKKGSNHFIYNTCQASLVGLIVLLIPPTVIAESSSEHWGAFVAGGFSTLMIHELGHMAVAKYHNTEFEYDGVTIIYPDADLTESEHLRIASAGFQFQWIASEIALGILSRDKQLTPRSKSFTRGIVAGQVAITLAYVTFLKNHPDGDIQGMSEASGLSNDELALIVAIPAVLDSWRLIAKSVPGWVPKLSIAYKGLGIAAIWTF